MFKHRQACILFLLCLMVAGMLWFDSPVSCYGIGGRCSPRWMLVR